MDESLTRGIPRGRSDDGPLSSLHVPVQVSTQIQGRSLSGALLRLDLSLCTYDKTR